MTPMCISRGYSPKEQYLTGGVSYFSPAADIYALGATLYYLLTGQNPPEAVDTPLKKLVFPASVPENVKAAIRHTMQYEPEDRTPSAAAFLDEIAIYDGISAIYTKTPMAYVDIYGHKKGYTGDLITKIGGEFICFTENEWQKVPDKSAYTKLGVVVNYGSCPAFYIALHDKAGGEEMTWYDAVNRYGEGVLPSIEQGVAMGENREKINNAMRAFGGTVMDNAWYWGKEDDSSYAWLAPQPHDHLTVSKKIYTYRVRPVARVAETAAWLAPQPHDHLTVSKKIYTYRVRPVARVAETADSVKKPLVQEENYGHKKGNTGDLITKIGGEYVCFPSGEWQKVPDKSAYTKLGVVVNDGTCPAFYVALHDKAGGERMTWDEAVFRYGEGILPSEKQCRALANNRDIINNAMRPFGGTVMDQSYWGKGNGSSFAWVVGMHYGIVYINGKTYTYRVRAVAPVPVASAR